MAKLGRSPKWTRIEMGGTVGDIESSVFLEALRQFHCASDPPTSAYLRIVGPDHGGGAEDEADAARRARPAQRGAVPHGDLLQVQGGAGGGGEG
mmetsp:Transcript_31081/g.75123  ORF Transcript_31081/g.75123 Transcript_31081/m.75123 type:complete len:94 (+) Transcript_31081:158-439(+)